MNAAFVHRLREREADVTAHLYGAGTHSWPYWEQELRHSLPLLVNALAGSSGSSRQGNASTRAVEPLN